MIELQPIRPAEYDRWLAKTVGEYADEKVRAGNWPAEGALERSQQEFRDLLPDGPATPKNHLFSLHDPATNQNVGVVWIALVDRGPKPIAFVYDFIVFDEFRRRGYASQALQALEAKVREFGLDTISLHVFGHNHAAIALYQKQGYIPTNINMSKKL
jgi:ribosomal protein S18 acetylase RimI-like enzyme